LNKEVYFTEPIKKPTLSEKNKITKLVDRMLQFNKRLTEVGDKKTSETAKLEEKIKKIDIQIDELVFDLYGLNKKEKDIIRSS
jgi:hypothetical protein